MSIHAAGLAPTNSCLNAETCRPRSPETMLAALRRWPAARTLEDVKECLDYCSKAWLQLFCRLGGAPLLLEVAPHALWSCHGVTCEVTDQTHPRTIGRMLLAGRQYRRSCMMERSPELH